MADQQTTFDRMHTFARLGDTQPQLYWCSKCGLLTITPKPGCCEDEFELRFPGEGELR